MCYISGAHKTQNTIFCESISEKEIMVLIPTLFHSAFIRQPFDLLKPVIELLAFSIIFKQLNSHKAAPPQYLIYIFRTITTDRREQNNIYIK